MMMNCPPGATDALEEEDISKEDGTARADAVANKYAEFREQLTDTRRSCTETFVSLIGVESREKE